MILICCIAICIDHHGIQGYQWKQLQVIDFVCTIYFYVELIICIWGKGFRGYLRKIVN
jgi:hypothetical protein